MKHSNLTTYQGYVIHDNYHLIYKYIYHINLLYILEMS